MLVIPFDVNRGDVVQVTVAVLVTVTCLFLSRGYFLEHFQNVRRIISEFLNR